MNVLQCSQGGSEGSGACDFTNGIGESRQLARSAAALVDGQTVVVTWSGFLLLSGLQDQGSGRTGARPPPALPRPSHSPRQRWVPRARAAPRAQGPATSPTPGSCTRQSHWRGFAGTDHHRRRGRQRHLLGDGCTELSHRRRLCDRGQRLRPPRPRSDHPDPSQLRSLALDLNGTRSAELEAVDIDLRPQTGQRVDRPPVEPARSRIRGS